MSLFPRDYLDENRPAKIECPPELALKIIRKAATMAAEFELRAIETMKTAAERALRRGEDVRVIVRQMEL